MLPSRWSGVALLAFVASSVGLSGCDQIEKLTKKDAPTADTSDDDTPKKKKSDDSAPSASVTATATATATASATASASASASAPSASASASAGPKMSGEALRYDDETALPDKKRRVTSTAPARKEANTTSDTVVTLQPGNEVDQVAEHQHFTLVHWKNKSGDHYAWVETAVAFRETGATHPGTPPVPIEIEGLGRPGEPAKPIPSAPQPTPHPQPPPTNTGRPPVAPLPVHH